MKRTKAEKKFADKIFYLVAYAQDLRDKDQPAYTAMWVELLLEKFRITAKGGK